MTSMGLVLAIESAIAGGSISLIRDGAEIANHISPTGPARAEDLLANIDALMAQTEIPLKSLDLIAVSAGPGSFTGIRIGLATALGLKSGLGIPMASVSALKAMALTHPGEADKIAVVPMGRSGICWQRFTRSGSAIIGQGEPTVISESDLLSAVASETDATFICHSAVAHLLSGPICVDFGANTALAVGIACSGEQSIEEPLFISRSRQ